MQELYDAPSQTSHFFDSQEDSLTGEVNELITLFSSPVKRGGNILYPGPNTMKAKALAHVSTQADKRVENIKKFVANRARFLAAQYNENTAHLYTETEELGASSDKTGTLDEEEKQKLKQEYLDAEFIELSTSRTKTKNNILARVNAYLRQQRRTTPSPSIMLSMSTTDTSSEEKKEITVKNRNPLAAAALAILENNDSIETFDHHTTMHLVSHNTIPVIFNDGSGVTPLGALLRGAFSSEETLGIHSDFAYKAIPKGTALSLLLRFIDNFIQINFSNNALICAPEELAENFQRHYLSSNTLNDWFYLVALAELVTRDDLLQNGGYPRDYQKEVTFILDTHTLDDARPDNYRLLPENCQYVFFRAHVATVVGYDNRSILFGGDNRGLVDYGKNNAKRNTQRELRNALFDAALNGGTHLIMGAVGCDVFENNPKDVAFWTAAVLFELQSMIDAAGIRIEFAIEDKKEILGIEATENDDLYATHSIQKSTIKTSGPTVGPFRSMFDKLVLQRPIADSLMGDSQYTQAEGCALFNAVYPVSRYHLEWIIQRYAQVKPVWADSNDQATLKALMKLSRRDTESTIWDTAATLKTYLSRIDEKKLRQAGDGNIATALEKNVPIPFENEGNALYTVITEVLGHEAVAAMQAEAVKQAENHVINNMAYV